MKNKEITKKNLAAVKELIGDVQNLTQKDFQELLDKFTVFHKYSLRNQILLSMAGCSQVAGYKTWLKVDRKVKKGARATWILAPRVFTKKEVKDDGAEEEITKIYFVSVPVFDISTTEGKEFNFNGIEKSKIEYSTVRMVAEGFDFTVREKPLNLELGGYIADGKNITINSNRKIDNVGTIIHEIVHGLLGHSDNEVVKEVKEQQAETATYLICKQMGIDRISKFYLKSWKLSENILKDFNKIDKVVKQIIEKIEEKKND